jgi:hypothetical protein
VYRADVLQETSSALDHERGMALIHTQILHQQRILAIEDVVSKALLLQVP